MIFMGRDLILVRAALDLARAEIHNRIVACPNVREYAADIEDLETDKRELDKLMVRIDEVLEKK